MEWINSLIDNYNIPVLSAFLIGMMTSISPCPLATNITAIAFISKDIWEPRRVLLNGLFYSLGRICSYTLLAIFIYFGLSSFSISSIFQGWGAKALGPILIFIGLVMMDFIKIKIGASNPKIERAKLWLSQKGYLGSFLLGVLFSLAFCPYSGIMFFSVLIPMTLKSSDLLLPPAFGLGVGLPVIFFSFIIAFGANKTGKIFSKISEIEKIIRKITALIFIVAGLYYLKNWI